MLAPSIGNIHGRYVNPPAFRLELLEALQSAVGPGTAANSYLVLHGTDDLPDELFRDCVRRGAYKINVNSWARDPQVEFWAKHLEKDPLPDVYEGGMQQFAKVCNRFFHLLGSAGKA
jgi:fructose-bisphosphate aldolase class II